MNAHTAFRSEAGQVKVSERQRGYTLVSTTIAFMISGFVLTGAWLAFRDMQAQMRVNFAERIMDQYAQSAMQELTNKLSWAWDAKMIQGGSRNTRWNFMIRDQINEHQTWVPDWQLEPNHYTQVRYQPTGGLLIGNQPPRWMTDHWRNEYVWFGRSSRAGEVRAFDRRDRMTMESLLFEVDNSRWAADQVERNKAPVNINVELTLQYRYHANSMFGLYSREYVRERTYRTSAYLRNWWSDINELRPGGGS
jgi:hypothetical protein